MSDAITFLAALVVTACSWSFAEYCLHRFAMHELHGRGIMSREHLEHHVRSTYTFDPIALLSWAGVLIVGFVVLMPIGWFLASPLVGVGMGVGWCVGYFFYEWEHAMSHRRAPRNRYDAWLRKHHFHHHFGHPMANHGVIVPLWDRVFGTLEQPDVVRVPRRLAMPWLLDEDGELLDEFAQDYVLVGTATSDERQAGIDRVKAFASIAPDD